MLILFSKNFTYVKKWQIWGMVWRYFHSSVQSQTNVFLNNAGLMWGLVIFWWATDVRNWFWLQQCCCCCWQWLFIFMSYRVQDIWWIFATTVWGFEGWVGSEKKTMAQTKTLSTVVRSMSSPSKADSIRQQNLSWWFNRRNRIELSAFCVLSGIQTKWKVLAVSNADNI